jgi:hypothetical protein
MSSTVIEIARLALDVNANLKGLRSILLYQTSQRQGYEEIG